MSLSEATPAQWDALRKKHPSIVAKYEHYFDKGMEEEMPEYDRLEEQLEFVFTEDEDMVNNPNHYNNGAIECIDAIEQSMTLEGFRGYLKGNVQKYVWRYESKGGIQDLMKAQWYLDKLISVTEED
tara:strand:+ start:64 stop:441 length:378 start_codon:yes stop_codon:yes gene_type:complete